MDKFNICIYDLHVGINLEIGLINFFNNCNVFYLFITT